MVLLPHGSIPKVSPYMPKFLHSHSSLAGAAHLVEYTSLAGPYLKPALTNLGGPGVGKGEAR